MRSRARKLRILLADDHELVRRGIRGLLNARKNWRVVGEARDGIEAVEKARKLKPHAIILDIDMPGLNGLEATPKLREVVPDAKIIILTLHETAAMVRRALEAGAHGFVLKSDLAEGLLTALKGIPSAKPFLTPKASDLVMQDLIRRQSEPEHAGGPEPRPTSRETEVLRLLASGKANKEIAAALGISVRTAETHRANIMKRLGLHSVAELVHYAIRHGLATGNLAEKTHYSLPN
jgi:DNA-binding NarL/FixJ family response regulator